MAPVEETPYKIKVTIRMNASGMVSVESAERVEVYYEEVPVKKPEETKKEEPKEEAKDEATPTEEPKEGEEQPVSEEAKAPEEAVAEASPAEPEAPATEMKRKTRKIKIEVVPVTANDR